MGVKDSSKDPGHLGKVVKYYSAGESRLGYQLLLGGTKHFGYYDKIDNPIHFKSALIRMEDRLGVELNLAQGSLVLDAGCGVGSVARAMATRFGLRVQGIDILDFNIAEAKRRSSAQGLDAKTTFAIGDYKNIQFAAATFDGVYTMETFVHSDDPSAVLEQFYRVLKPGGRLVMFEYSSTPERDLSKQAYAALTRICDLAEMPGWLELQHGVLERKLSDAGFTDVRSTDITQNILPMLAWFSKIGKFPYFLGRTLGIPEKVANAMSGVETFKYQEAWRYKIYTAVKPSI